MPLMASSSGLLTFHMSWLVRSCREGLVQRCPWCSEIIKSDRFPRAGRMPRRTQRARPAPHAANSFICCDVCCTVRFGGLVELGHGVAGVGAGGRKRFEQRRTK